MQTELRKKKNRINVSGENVKFCVFTVQGQYEDVITGQGFGALTANETIILKTKAETRKQGLTKQQKKRLSHQINQVIPGNQTVSGMKTSLMFASNQGMNFVDPDAASALLQKRSAGDYFKKDSGFKTVINENLPTKKLKN